MIIIIIIIMILVQQTFIFRIVKRPTHPTSVLFLKKIAVCTVCTQNLKILTTSVYSYEKKKKTESTTKKVIMIVIM